MTLCDLAELARVLNNPFSEMDEQDRRPARTSLRIRIDPEQAHVYTARRNGRMSPMAPHETSSTTPEQSEIRTQFTDLLKNRREELGIGLSKAAERSVDPETGKAVKRGRIYRLEGNEEGGITPPDFWELRGLAVGFQLPIERLQDAAGSQFHGRDPLRSGSGEAAAYVRKLDSLPPDQRERLLRLIDTLAPPHSSDQE
jgi:hypothetical protein